MKLDMDEKTLGILVAIAAEIVRGAFRMLEVAGLPPEDARARLEAELARAAMRPAKNLPEVE